MQSNDITIFLIILIPALIAAFVAIASSSKPKKIEDKEELSHVGMYNDIYAYMDTAFLQAKTLLRAAMIICSGGLLIIIYGLFGLVPQNNTEASSGNISIILAGITIAVIGILILFIYRSTLQQTDNYLKTLERLTNINLSKSIIKEIENYENEQDVKITNLTEIATVLLEIPKINS